MIHHFLARGSYQEMAKDSMFSSCILKDFNSLANEIPDPHQSASCDIRTSKRTTYRYQLASGNPASQSANFIGTLRSEIKMALVEISAG